MDGSSKSESLDKSLLLNLLVSIYYFLKPFKSGTGLSGRSCCYFVGGVLLVALSLNVGGFNMIV